MPGKKKNKIFVIRNVFSNIGDEAMLACEIEEIKHTFPQLELKILTDNPQRISQIYEVETDYSETVLTTPFSNESNRLIHKSLMKNDVSIKNHLSKTVDKIFTGILLPQICRKFLVQSEKSNNKQSVFLPIHQKRLLNQLLEADLVIGGGGLIPSIKGIFLPKITLYKTLKQLRIPYILHGQTVIPESGAENVYQNATKVLLRDFNLSRKTALGFGVEETKLVEKLDPAFNLKTFSLETFFQSNEINFFSKPFLAINLREWKGKDLTHSFSNLAVALNSFYQLKPELQLVFFSMQLYGNEDDYTTIEKFKRILNPEIKTMSLDANLSPSALKSVLAKAFGVITARYHGAVFGLSSRVPTIGISVSTEYDIKLKGIFSMFEATDFLLAANKIESSKILNILKTIKENRAEMVSKLEDKMPKPQDFPTLGSIIQETLKELSKI